MEQQSKGQWGSNFGFLMAAIGSAVGFGSLWGFPYKMGANGGFAFLLLYLILILFVGMVITLCELSLGRHTAKGIIGAYESVGKKYSFIGWFGVISSILILGFFTMLGGYCIKYTLANFGDMFGASWGINGTSSAEYFTNFYTNQSLTILFTFIFLALTIIIVRNGISAGIEKFTKIAMPALFLMLLIVIIRSVTLDGASEGLAFMFKPNWSMFNSSDWISTLAATGSQILFSLSLGMGIMITFGSYLKNDENLEKNSIIIPLTVTVISIMSGLAIMPAVFATGLNPASGPGLLFVTFQSVFDAMGSVGEVFGSLFYLSLFIAAIASSISLLETICSVIMDKRQAKGKGYSRNTITLAIGVIIAALSAFISIDGLGANGLPQIFGQACWVDTFYLISAGILMPLGVLAMAIVLPTKLVNDEVTLNGKKFFTRNFFNFCIKFVVPIMMLLILFCQIDTIFNLGIF